MYESRDGERKGDGPARKGGARRGHIRSQRWWVLFIIYTEHHRKAAVGKSIRQAQGSEYIMCVCVSALHWLVVWGYEVMSSFSFCRLTPNKVGLRTSKQESIPVGCVPPVCWPWVCVQEVGMSKGMSMGRHPPPMWTDGHLWKHYLAPNFVCGR